MPSYGGFEVLVDEHSVEELLEFIRGLGFKVERTNQVTYGPQDKEVGWKIVGTDITFRDPLPSVRFNGRGIVFFNLPYKGTELIKHDHEADKKLMSKLKRRFAIKPKK